MTTGFGTIALDYIEFFKILLLHTIILMLYLYFIHLVRTSAVVVHPKEKRASTCTRYGGGWSSVRSEWETMKLYAVK
jgi:hypothetical protein